MHCCNVRTVVCTYCMYVRMYIQNRMLGLLWEAGCFELVAALYSDHYGQVPLYHVAVAAMLLGLNCTRFPWKYNVAL